jgi:predicted acetyltransferase
MLSIRRAKPSDELLYFDWANDETVRQNSISKSKINLKDHVKWFHTKLSNQDTVMLIFSEGKVEIGQLRIEVDHGNREAVINYSIDKNSRGKGFGTLILSLSYEYYSRLKINYPMIGFVKPGNAASVSAFTRAGFLKDRNVFTINDEAYIKFTREI